MCGKVSAVMMSLWLAIVYMNTAQSGLLRGKSWMLMCTLKERFGIAVLCEPILGVKGLGGLHEPRR